MPDHRRAEAAVILTARHQAAIDKINKLMSESKSPVAPSITTDILLGEF